MKKTLALLAFFLVIGISGQTFKYGLTGNFHRGSVSGVHDRSVGRYGFGIGAFAQWSIVENDIFDSAWLYLMPQIEYSTQGENAKAEEARYGLQKFHHDYIAAQLYLKYFVHRGNIKRDLYFFGGPRIEFLVNENRQVDPAYDDVYYKYNLDGTVNKTSIGVSIGAGMKISQSLEGFLRYDQGFSQVYPDNNRNNTFNRQLAVGLNYYILPNWW